ncbi:cytochrome P450 [Pseudovirgaria hyperparasitica]|uniref:Cytochrome P450 n=1 Tax=Pseudovirgaria hyperparasitica TaxID=470096 RepID=A0A6A6WJG0_9PEZI|nr:cytochrome P450 [Pseudovirgaria hyperparasitica]KAF2762310.1 cytochrome P450 [Pseudovirgaria hyperparasitica]
MMMESQLLTCVGDYVPIISTITFICSAFILSLRLLTKNPLSQIPLIGEEIGNAKARRDYYLAHGKELYLRGCKKCKSFTGFRITTADGTEDRLVISPRYLDELRKLPDSVLSFEGALEESMEKRFTKVPAFHSMVVTPHVIKADLTPALVRINPVLFDEVNSLVRKEIGDNAGWTPVNIHQKLLRIVAIASGRIFVGPELCYNEDYIESAIKYTIELMDAHRKVKGLSPWLKRLKGNFLPEVKTLRKREENFNNLIAPVLKQRRCLAASGEVLPDDVLSWLITKADKHGTSSTEDIAYIQLGMTFAAIHTTTMTSTNVFYDLAAHPEYITPLREEIRTVLAEHNGVLTVAALQQLRKMDSFIKESMRFHLGSAVSMRRKVMAPFTLSNGQFIPAGTMIEVAGHAISRDPELYPEPEKFKPFRFAELRDSGAEGASRYQFVSVTKDLMTFGFGRHACVGRFFAANEIKMIVAQTLQKYDMKMPEGQTERFPNLEFGVHSMADPTRELSFKNVEV